ncbi:hypothetical protein B0H12DRAFT_1069112 [Mycena haematopus]|nr:hypothetical protein B0H12DRAFT_1069112 [Mycena haematopus]
MHQLLQAGEGMFGGSSTPRVGVKWDSKGREIFQRPLRPPDAEIAAPPQQYLSFGTAIFWSTSGGIYLNEFHLVLFPASPRPAQDFAIHLWLCQREFTKQNLAYLVTSHLNLILMTDAITADDAEAIRIRAAACQKLVDQFVNEALPSNEFLQRLREAGATTAEAEDYVQQARARLDAGTQPPPSQSQSNSREGTPEGLSDEELSKFRRERDALIARRHQQEEERRRLAVEDIEWGLLRAKIDALIPARRPNHSAITASDLEQILGIQLSQSASPTSISAAALSAAPHLAQLSAGVNTDPHLEQTWKLRRAFGSDKTIDPIIDVMQLQDLVDPLPRTIWRSIIQDHYVDFEKLFAAFLPVMIIRTIPKVGR